MKATPVIVKLDHELSERLRFVQQHLPVRPPLTGLVSNAVEIFLDVHFENYPEIKLAWERRRTHLRLEP